MAVSKRLRYEVLRRDNYACRYCGRHAPEVRLTIDHVLAVALGGKDEATNLVACCSDCNSGKSATPADAALIADVDQDALRWSAAMHVAVAKSAEDLDAALAYRARFLELWREWHVIVDRSQVPLDEEWRESIESLRTRGLSLGWLEECVRGAMVRKDVAPCNKFRYACGIAWNKITDIDRMMREAWSST